MALDVGAKKIGIALSDALNSMAHPYKVFESSGVLKDAELIREIIEENDVDEVVVGMPVTLGGEVGPQAAQISEYARVMEKNLGVKIILKDERFTSKEARRMLRESGKKGISLEDAAAAAIILQEYLDSKGD